MIKINIDLADVLMTVSFFIKFIEIKISLKMIK